MFRSPMTVAAESNTIRLQIDADSRLAAAAGGVARYLADCAGLENLAVANLQSTIVAACEQAFQNLDAEHPSLEVSLSLFADRIEVALAHCGESAPAVGLDTVAGFAAQLGADSSGAGAWSGVDRVQYETQGGSAVTRLTKYLVGPASSAA
jgi:hypothetical protein